MPKPLTRQLVLVVDNVRSAHNVGSIFRSADAFGVSKVILTGISPYPELAVDTRLPHIRHRAHAAIAKTALGAEKSVPYEWKDQISTVLSEYRNKGYQLCALEQSNTATDIRRFVPRFPCLLVVGNELEGINQAVLNQADVVLEIPMQGNKESLNVGVATGIALYHLSG